MKHTDKEIELSHKANDIYCDMGQKLEILKEALNNIMISCDVSNPDHELFYFTAKNALDNIQ